MFSLSSSSGWLIYSFFYKYRCKRRKKSQIWRSGWLFNVGSLSHWTSSHLDFFHAAAGSHVEPTHFDFLVLSENICGPVKIFWHKRRSQCRFSHSIAFHRTQMHILYIFYPFLRNFLILSLLCLSSNCLRAYLLFLWPVSWNTYPLFYN